MAGQSLAILGLTTEPVLEHIAVKEAVLPFERFPGTDMILGPEMRSTGEVMGIDTNFGTAFAKAELGAGQRLPLKGTVFVSMNQRDKPQVVPIVQDLIALGFDVVATTGTQKVLQDHGIVVEPILKVHEGRPHVLDRIKNQQIQLIINSPTGEEALIDDQVIRRTAIAYKIPIITTIAGAKATAAAIHSLQAQSLQVKALQEYHQP